MANHFSALKRARQTTKRTARNRANSSTLRTALRTLRESLEKGDKAAAGETYRETVPALDKAIQKGVLHEKTPSRYKSRLSKRWAALKKALKQVPGRLTAGRKFYRRFFLTFPSGLLYLASSQDIKAVSAGPWDLRPRW